MAVPRDLNVSHRQGVKNRSGLTLDLRHYGDDSLAMAWQNARHPPTDAAANRARGTNPNWR